MSKFVYRPVSTAQYKEICIVSVADRTLVQEVVYTWTDNLFKWLGKRPRLNHDFRKSYKAIGKIK